METVDCEVVEMRHDDDSFDRIFNVVFPVLMVAGFLLAIGVVVTVVHFVRKFW